MSSREEYLKLALEQAKLLKVEKIDNALRALEDAGVEMLLIRLYRTEDHTMKIFHIFVLIIGLCLLCISCEKPEPTERVDEGSITDNVYTSKEIGWTIEIPKSWTLIPTRTIDSHQSVGQDAIEESTGLDVDTSALKNLVGFQKDRFNLFQSTSEPFEEEYKGEWEEHNAILRDVILQTYRDQGVKIEASEIETENIGGLEFHKFSVQIISPGGDLILNQIIFSRLINGFDFGVNINYNNEELGREMLQAWRDSEFEL